MSVSSTTLEKPMIGNEVINRNSLILLLLLIVPTAIMASVLFLWPGVMWIAAVPYTALEALGAFVMLLLAVFILARYRNRQGILYFSAGLIALGITNTFLTVSMPHTGLYIWLNSCGSVLGGVLFLVFVRKSAAKTSNLNPTITARETGLKLGIISVVAFTFGVVSVVFKDILPQSVTENQLNSLGWIMNGLPMVLFLWAVIVQFYRYRKTGAQELFLFVAIAIFLFQSVEALFFAETWSIIWWFWQTLRLAVYLIALVFVLREHLKTSESLATEVVERQKVENALRKSEEDWRNSFNALDEAMLIINRDYSIERMNNTGLTLYNQSGGDHSDRKCYQVVQGRDRLCPDCPAKVTLRSKKPYSTERYDVESGKYFSVKAAPILDETNRVTKFVYVIRDITREVKAREKEKALQQELNLTSRLASIGEVAAGIAHEINNPLTGVIGFAQMLAEMDVPEQMREAVDVIHDGARRTANIVQKLLTFARRNKPVKEYGDINAILKSTIEIRAYEMRNNNIEITTRFDPELPRTMANFGQLQQVFLNIIINAEQAIAAAQTQGKLVAKTEHGKGKIIISISDNGAGIVKENMNKLFDPFFTTKGDSGGTGLGLSISYGIIKEHNGKIKVKSQQGKGATFIIELPVVAQVSEPERKLEQPSGKSIKPLSTDKKIIVIDDEPNICRVLYRLLSSAGYQVETISDAQLALSKLKDTNFDLILLDIKMPGMSGIEFYEKMQKIDPALPQKVICITGDIISTQNKIFMEKTSLPCVTKPFSVNELLLQVKSNLGVRNAQETRTNCR